MDFGRQNGTKMEPKWCANAARGGVTPRSRVPPLTTPLVYKYTSLYPPLPEALCVTATSLALRALFP